tara:strand:- start:365 stop:667 length:303 start_codon:yes stop_codon:yes gene_type:complete
MKNTITVNDFTNNTQLKDAFSYEGLVALFDYLEDYEEDCGVEINFDPVALRCEFTEYATYQEISDHYTDLEGDTPEEMLEWLQDRTQIIEFETGIILQNF